MAYFLFILLTATLFIRPAEVVPALYALPVYECIILCCLTVSFSRILDQLTPQSLAENPITACVLSLWAAIVLSHLSHFFIWGARMSGFEFFKVVAYYLLLVAVIDTEDRLKGFLRWLLLFICILAALALLDHHGIVDIPSIETMQQGAYDAGTGERQFIPRLRSTGIFHDPNDLAMILTAGVVISLCFLGDPAGGLLRRFWIVPAATFVYAVYLTQSRGGLLALLAALGTLVSFRWGWKRAAWAALVAVPVVLAAFQGRMTSFGEALEGGTGQSRIEIWSEGLQLFKQAPLFGIGHGQYVEEAGHVAHNSFLHCLVELGLFGGSLFLGLFVAALIILHRLRNDDEFVHRTELGWMLPYMAAVLVGFAVSMLSLSRAYIAPTYLVMGWMTAYTRLAVLDLRLPILVFDSHFVRRIAAASIGFLAAAYALIRATL